MNISQIDKNICTGCSACSQKCPQCAIEMRLDAEGFYYPYVFSNKCNNCGLCVNACPAQDNRGEKNEAVRIISSCAKDEAIRLTSSSGGIFALLATNIMKSGGIVYGAAFIKECKEVCHTSTDQTSLKDIMRSKYVQSRIGCTYRDAETQLKGGRKVLFSGTPCQVKGLRAYLQKNYDNLITVDFMCHGVPSTGLFKDVINYYECAEKSEVIDFTFREKDLGWRDQVTKIYLSNRKILTKKSSYYYYYYAFLNNFILRKSCYDCACYNTHVSDLTLADNWSCSEEDNKGISLIIINTDKGNIVYDNISNQTVGEDITRKFYGYEVYRHNYDLKNRKSFFEYYLKNGFEKTLTCYFKKAMRKYKICRLIQEPFEKMKRIINKCYKMNKCRIFQSLQIRS